MRRSTTDYPVARGMTRSSFGMPDTSRAARYILKDYVNARLLYAHPPPGIDPDEFMSSSREETLDRLEAEFQAGKKRAPATHVVKNADTFVAAAPSSSKPRIQSAEDGQENGNDDEFNTLDPSTTGTGSTAADRARQATSRQVKSTAASAPTRSGKQKAAALDDVYFTETGPAPRPVIMGRKQAPIEQDEGLGYSRNTAYPHQRMLGPDGRPLPMAQVQQGRQGGVGGKKAHFKTKEGKKRSGKGYD